MRQLLWVEADHLHGDVRCARMLPCPALGDHAPCYHSAAVLLHLHTPGFHGTAPSSMCLATSHISKHLAGDQCHSSFFSSICKIAMYSCFVIKDRVGIWKIPLAAGSDRARVIEDGGAEQPCVNSGRAKIEDQWVQQHTNTSCNFTPEFALSNNDNLFDPKIKRMTNSCFFPIILVIYEFGFG